MDLRSNFKKEGELEELENQLKEGLYLIVFSF